MKKWIYLLIGICCLTSCAYVDGVRNEKSVTPIPPNVTPPAGSSSSGVPQEEAAATTNAAKTIAPATR